MANAVVNGIDTTAANEYIAKKTEKDTTGLDKDAFLQLLVTQMQYQDPLNPGDSTEYMSQLAQYSALEATMNISDTLEKGNALNLVGQYVILNTTDSAGNQTPVSGLVEYATIKDGEVLLSINGTYYPASDLDSVVDYDYFLYLQQQAAGGAGGDSASKPQDGDTTVDGSDSGSGETGDGDAADDTTTEEA